jgi:hypothetical protein
MFIAKPPRCLFCHIEPSHRYVCSITEHLFYVKRIRFFYALPLLQDMYQLYLSMIFHFAVTIEKTFFPWNLSTWNVISAAFQSVYLSLVLSIFFSSMRKPWVPCFPQDTIRIFGTSSLASLTSIQSGYPPFNPYLPCSYGTPGIYPVHHPVCAP